MKCPCHVCDSPQATTLHFGGRTCKACAAFFRRTVSMEMDRGYQCNGNGLHPCQINYQLRMICRKCRFTKCLRAGMKRELVQARTEKMDRPERPESLNSRTSKSFELSDSRASSMDMSLLTPPAPLSAPYNGSVYAEVIKHTDWPPSTSSPCSVDGTPTPSSICDNSVARAFMKMEAALNDRRRIMYADVDICHVFGSDCECPYTRESLRPFDYRTFRSFDRHDFIMIYDYTRALPGFDQLGQLDKRIIYRNSCAVDCMISCAYYTYRLGRHEKLLVLFDGEFLKMDPLPMVGSEEGAADFFQNKEFFKCKEDCEKYRSLMPTKVRQWQQMAEPFCRLEVTFEEFCLLKALTIWQMSYGTMNDLGKDVCRVQRDEILSAMHRSAQERGIPPSERMAELIFAMTYIIEQLHELILSLHQTLFFNNLNKINMDRMVEEVLNYPRE